MTVTGILFWRVARVVRLCRPPEDFRPPRFRAAVHQSSSLLVLRVHRKRCRRPKMRQVHRYERQGWGICRRTFDPIRAVPHRRRRLGSWLRGHVPPLTDGGRRRFPLPRQPWRRPAVFGCSDDGPHCASVPLPWPQIRQLPARARRVSARAAGGIISVIAVRRFPMTGTYSVPDSRTSEHAQPHPMRYPRTCARYFQPAGCYGRF